MPDPKGNGWDWAFWIAVIGLFVNLIFNTINYLFNRNTRRKTVSLADFNSNVRTPILEALSGLDSIMDGADDICLSTKTHAEKIANTKELNMKFHASRRILARRLNDCDTSLLVAGDDWGACDEGFMDEATEAFEKAGKTESHDEMRAELLKVAKAINSLRTEIKNKLDAEARRLMF